MFIARNANCVNTVNTYKSSWSGSSILRTAYFGLCNFGIICALRTALLDRDVTPEHVDRVTFEFAQFHKAFQKNQCTWSDTRIHVTMNGKWPLQAFIYEMVFLLCQFALWARSPREFLHQRFAERTAYVFSTHFDFSLHDNHVTHVGPARMSICM